MQRLEVLRHAALTIVYNYQRVLESYYALNDQRPDIVGAQKQTLFLNYSLFYYILHPLIFLFEGNIKLVICKDCLGIFAEGKMLKKKIQSLVMKMFL